MEKARANKSDRGLSFTATAATVEKTGKGLSFTVILTVGILCALLLVASLTAARHIYRTYAPTLGNSEHMLARGKPQQAKLLLDKIKTAKPGENARALILRGNVLYSLLLERMSEENWSSYGVNPENWLSNPLADEAEKCFLDAMEIAPDNPEPRRVLGNLYREQGRFAEAEAMLRSALELDETGAETFLALGLLYAEGERRGAAERTLLYAWELGEGNAKIAKNIGYFYRYYKDDPQASILWFGRYLDCADPRRDRDIYQVRMELRRLLERYPEYSEGREIRSNSGASRIFPSLQRN